MNPHFLLLHLILARYRIIPMPWWYRHLASTITNSSRLLPAPKFTDYSYSTFLAQTILSSAIETTP